MSNMFKGACWGAACGVARRENLHGKVKVFIGDGFVAQSLELVCGSHAVLWIGLVCFDNRGVSKIKYKRRGRYHTQSGAR